MISTVATDFLTHHSRISVLTTCKLLDDPVFGVSVETIPGLPAAHGQVWSKVCCTVVLRIICTALAMYTLDGSVLLLPRHLFCRPLLFLFFVVFLGCNHFVLCTSLKICLIISFVDVVTCLDVFCSDSIAVTCVAFFQGCRWQPAPRFL